MLLTAAGSIGTFGYVVVYARSVRRLSSQEFSLGRMAATFLMAALLLVATSLPMFLPLLSPLARTSIGGWPGLLVYCACFLGFSLPSMLHMRRNIPRSVGVERPRLSPANRFIAAALFVLITVAVLGLWTTLIAWLIGARIEVFH